jgi:hypothetical protein
MRLSTRIVFVLAILFTFTLLSINKRSKKFENKAAKKPLTSLEILEVVLEYKKMENWTDLKELPSCLVANRKRTNALVASVLRNKERSLTLSYLLPTPILNVGMPKIGSSTLSDFFRCAGYRTTHDYWKAGCMRDAAEQNRPPLQTCHPEKQAVSQLDSNYPHEDNCFYPQISLLDEIHQEHHNATFILNFRPLDDWIKSATAWGTPGQKKLADRWDNCSLPGLVSNGVGRDRDQDLRDWFCSHVRHIREFVSVYPSHALIELDLYDTQGSTRVMSSLFGANRSCWGHSNVGKDKMK